jgi:8-oxo-dGTP diphosphatase
VDRACAYLSQRDAATLSTVAGTTPKRLIRISAAVIVDSEGRILLVRKRGTTAFMQPGGKVDDDESALDALRRELAEELDVTVLPSQIRALGRYVAEAANEPDHLVDAELFAVTLHDEPRASAEIDEIAWIDSSAPGDVELAPLTRQVVLGMVRNPMNA